MIFIVFLISCGPATKQKRIQRTFELANVKLEQGYYDEAVSLYSQVIAKDPEITDAFMNRGVAYFESGHFVAALADYNHVYFNYPEYPEVIFNLVYCHLELDRYDQAKDDLDQLKSLYPDSALVDVIEGLFWTDQNYLNRGVSSFSSAMEKDPMNFDARTNRGVVYYHQKKYEQAEADLKKALILNEYAPQVLNPLSLVLTAQGRHQEADSIIDMALQIIPDHPHFLNNKGLIQLNTSNLDVADSLIRKSLQLDSLNAHAYKNLGLLEMKNNRIQLGMKAFEKSIALDSSLLDSYDGLIDAMLMSKEKTEKIDKIKQLKIKYLPK